MSKGRSWVAIGLLPLLALSVASCGGDDSGKGAAPSTSTTIDASSTTTAPTSSATTEPTGPTTTVSLEAQPPAPDSTTRPAPRGTTTRASTTSQAPTVTSMTIPSTVECPTKAVRTIDVKWTTKGATKVAVSIDTPTGYYEQNLPANGHLGVPFPCDGTSQTYFVVAEDGSGGRAVTSRTVKPVVPTGTTAP